jgi:hypothetical protein
MAAGMLFSTLVHCKELVLIRPGRQEVPEEIRQQLAPGESLLWHGMPRQGWVLRRSDAFMIPFSILWCGVVLRIFSSWNSRQFVGHGSPLFSLFPLIFLVGGMYFLIGRFAIDARQRARTRYAVTSERVLIFRGLFSRKVTSMSLHNLSEMTLSQKASGEGSIVFGRPQVVVQPPPGMEGAPVVQTPAPPAFDLILGADAVHALIRDAQRRLLGY